MESVEAKRAPEPRGSGLLRALDEFFWELRREGLALSTDQAICAARAAGLVGIGDRARLLEAIACSVAIRREEAELVRSLGRRFFRPEGAHARDLWGRLAARGFGKEDLGALGELLEAAARASVPEAFGIRLLEGGDAELDHLLAAAGMRRLLAGASGPAQAGFFAQRAGERLGIQAAARALKGLRRALEEQLGKARGQALAEALAEELERHRRRVRDHVERSLERASAPPDPRAPLADRPFSALSEEELGAARHAVRRLAERLRGGERQRRRRARRGRIDPHKTLRLALRTGGAPFRLARRTRRRDRPKLFLLCDVSDSIRLHQLFVLEFAWAAHDLFERTRSFVFVADVAEVTHLLARGPRGRRGASGQADAGEAIGRIGAGEVLGRADASNYGQALASFERRFGRALDRRSVLVVIGDGRTNYLADGVACLERMRARVRALLWITPEDPGAWIRGDSAMRRYARVATKVLSARTPRELEIAAREIAARR